jgi:hemerythrin-like domain-containing protein
MQPGMQPGMQPVAQSSENLFSRLSMMLLAHMESEEKNFYEPLKNVDQTRDYIAHGFQEHNEARQMLKQIQGIASSSSDWMSMVQKLQQAIHHHIEDEEGKTFPAAQQVVSASQAEDMGSRFKSEEQRILQQRSA